MTRTPTIGLALGGGGARGLAHIGVLRVLEEEGIPIDLLAGTSMGGLLGCLYAAGLSAAEMQEEALRVCNTRSLVRLTDPSLLHGGLFAGTRVEAYLESLLGERGFGDLRRRMAVVAVDLVTGAEVVLSEGLVVPAIRSTIAVPGFFAPVEMDGRVLVDGGVLNNVPADVARSMGAEVLIAVDVHGDYSGTAASQVGALRRLTAPVRETMDVLYESLGVMMVQLTRAKLALASPEVTIVPDLAPDLSAMTGYSRCQEAIDAGLEAARVAVPQIHEQIARHSGTG